MQVPHTRNSPNDYCAYRLYDIWLAYLASKLIYLLGLLRCQMKMIITELSSLAAPWHHNIVYTADDDYVVTSSRRGAENSIPATREAECISLI